MKTIGLMMMIILTMLAGAACQKQRAISSSADANSTRDDSAGNGSADRASSETETPPAPKGLKPSDPCGWFNDSLEIKAEEYKQSPSIPDLYYCRQLKSLANQSAFEYHAIGDAETIKKFSVFVRVNERHSAKQKENSHRMLALAAMEIADRASGHQLTNEILTAILSGDTKEFTLDPDGDPTKPQLRIVSVENNKRNDGWYSMNATLEF